MENAFAHGGKRAVIAARRDGTRAVIDITDDGPGVSPTNAARISLKKMMRTAGHTVVFGSVKLDLGREIVRKESEQMGRAFQLITQQAAAGRMELELADGQTGKII